MKIKLKKIKEDRIRIIYKIDQYDINLDNKIFKINKNTSNLSAYLNNKGDNLINFLNKSINNKCINCSNTVTKNRFERNKFITYKFCDNCNNIENWNKYDKVNCIICNTELFKKDMIFSTCGKEECKNTHRNNINKIIKNTHWTKKENVNEILKKRSEKRLSNDKKLNRKYKAWNKGKKGIYTKETIEKIRNSTIKQMKEGKIKKTKIEIIFENFLIENDIKYVYSFIYKKRQFDFYLKDYNLIIEINGDYWHANPKFWDIYGNDNNKKKLYETQKMKIKDDIIKEKMIEDSNYKFIKFWEDDIHNNFSLIIETLIKKFNIKIKNNK